MDGVPRTRELITEAIGADYATDVVVSTGEWMGHPSVTVTVRSPSVAFWYCSTS